MRFALAIGYRLLVMREALDDLCLFSQFGDEFFYAVYPNASFSRLWGFDFLSFYPRAYVRLQVGYIETIKRPFLCFDDVGQRCVAWFI